MSSVDIDLTLGVYRRIYAGFLMGKRINSVSMEAEAWFWRLHALADDYGNLHADPKYLAGNAAPRRPIDADYANRLTDELVKAGLVNRYETNDDHYLHIVGFEERQPAGKNGRRIQRIPGPPEQQSGESGGIRGNPGESGGIRPPRPLTIPLPRTLTTPTERASGNPELPKPANQTPPESMPWESTAAGPHFDARAAIFRAYPNQQAKHAGMLAIGSAAEIIALRNGTDVWAAYIWLHKRVKVYAASGLVKSMEAQYVPQCKRWMDEARYDDDDKAWSAPAPPAPVDIGAAAVALVRREQAERRAREAAKQGAKA